LVIADPQFTGVERLDMIPNRRDAALEIEALELEDTTVEAREIARRIRQALDSGRYTPRQIVVLLRSLKGEISANVTTRQLEIAFHEQRIPSVIQGVQSFYRNTIIRTLVRLLRVVCNPDDDSVLEELLGTKLVPDIGPKRIELLRDIRKRQGKQTLWDLLTAKTADVLERELWLLETLPVANFGHSRLIILREMVAVILDLQARVPRRPPFEDFLFYLRTGIRFDQIFHTVRTYAVDGLCAIMRA
jgi:superfamily I DNA/RNA helicase